jgi:hypothetical protein
MAANVIQTSDRWLARGKLNRSALLAFLRKTHVVSIYRSIW